MKKLMKKLCSILLVLTTLVLVLGCEEKKPTVINAPVFSGIDDIVIEKGTPFLPLEGVSVTDVEDGTINLSAVKVDASGVNVNVVGEYTVTYTVYDSDGNRTVATRKVTVVYTDNTNPELYGVGDTTVTIGDTSFTELKNVSAFDSVDGNLTDKILVTGTVDVWTKGVYELTYEVKDSAGNVSKVLRKVTVDEGNFAFGDEDELSFEAASGVLNAKTSGGKIYDSICEYSLVKLTLKLEAVTEVKVKITLAGALTKDEEISVNGVTLIEKYFTIKEELVDALVSITGAVDVKEAYISYCVPGDKEAPEIIIPEEKKVVLPKDISKEEAIKEILSGITATDNLDGNVTSKLECDLTDVNLNTPGKYQVMLRVSDSLGNETTKALDIMVCKTKDTNVINNPSFDGAFDQIKVSSGSGGDVTGEVIDGMYRFTIKKAGGWPSGDSPYLTGISTDDLKEENYYLFKMDVKADVARNMNIRAGLELMSSPWIENFKDVVKYQITTEWTTIYYIFYVPSKLSADGSSTIKFELQLGSIDWSEAENNNVIYFDNMQFYQIQATNKAPVISLVDDAKTKFAKGSTLPDFTKFVTIFDNEDGEIQVMPEMIDSSNVDMTKAGTYKVIYTVTDADGATSIYELEITILDEADVTGPVITISEELLAQLKSLMPVKEGTDLTKILENVLANIKIIDDVDGEITPTMDMINLGGLDIKACKVGSYNVTIKTTDKSKNPSNEIVLTVVVVDAIAPTLVGVHNFTVVKGTKINPLSGVVAYDTNDGIIELTLSDVSGFEAFLNGEGMVIGSAGEYQVSYTVKDEAGNESSLTAIVTIIEEDTEYNYNGAQDLLAKEQPLGGGGHKSTITYENGIGVINYTGAFGYYASAVQLKYTSCVALEAGKKYKLVFEAKALLPRDVLVYFVDGNGEKIPGFKVDETGGKLKIGITNNYYVYEYEFVPTSTTSQATFELDWDWESFSYNSAAQNVISIKQLKIVKEGKNEEEPVVLEPVVIDDFEGYEDTIDLAKAWAKRYDGTNYSEGFSLVTVDGNKVVKFDYKSDKKYIFRYLGELPTLTNDYKYVRIKAQISSEVKKFELWLYWAGGQNGIGFDVSTALQSDGYYYFPISSFGKEASQITGFGIAFNYQKGDTAYFDDFEFVTELPK